MKRGLVRSALMLVLAGFFVAAQAQIVDSSAHNLSAASTFAFKAGITKGTQTQICVYCHTPHSTTTVALLWNRTNPTASNFSMYTPISTNTGILGDASLRCLSCHDGTTGLDAVVKTPSSGGLTTGQIDTSQVPTGLVLTNDHPVGFPISGTGFQLPTQYAEHYSNKVECASCHDPHTSAQPKFVRDANTSSRMCKDCHLK